MAYNKAEWIKEAEYYDELARKDSLFLFTAKWCRWKAGEGEKPMPREIQSKLRTEKRGRPAGRTGYYYWESRHGCERAVLLKDGGVPDGFEADYADNILYIQKHGRAISSEMPVPVSGPQMMQMIRYFLTCGWDVYRYDVTNKKGPHLHIFKKKSDEN